MSLSLILVLEALITKLTSILLLHLMGTKIGKLSLVKIFSNVDKATAGANRLTAILQGYQTF